MAFEQYIDDLKETYQDLRQEVNNFLGADAAKSQLDILRYPLKLGSAEYANMPFMLFMIKRMEYNGTSAGESINVKTGETITGQNYTKNIKLNSLKSLQDLSVLPEGYICLYLPNNLSFSDTAKYEIQSATGLLASFVSGEVPTLDDLKLKLQQEFLNRAGKSIGAVKELFKGKDVISPREFVTFQAPAIREFSFSFKFAPTSIQEVKIVNNIIKKFRESMYPIQASEYRYSIPKSFSVSFQNVEGMIKIPEVVLTSCQLTYNPTSPSYYHYSRQKSDTQEAIDENYPIEIDMSLSFQEVEAIHRGLVKKGY